MENANVEEAELVASTPTLSSPQAVMLTPSQLTKQVTRDKEMRGIINNYIKDNMVSGKDYGTIQIQGHTSKPSLFKPGSEKFCSLFKIRATFRRDVETVEMLGNTAGIIAYVCELVDSRGRIVGEGRGTFKVDVEGKDFDINKGVKIAEKRAQIDAVLRTGGLSDFFTQDMEDAPRDAPKGVLEAPSGSSKPATMNQIKYIETLQKERGTSLPGPTNMTEASELIQKLLAMPKLSKDEGDFDGPY